MIFYFLIVSFAEFFKEFYHWLVVSDNEAQQSEYEP